VAALASDVRRLGRDAQNHFARGLDEMIDTLAAAVAEQRPGNDQQTSREEAISFYCEMVGALLLSRAVGEADPSLANAILTAERKTLLAGAAETQD
jgi:TetR/AcrR family transcriptional repressor of nem operon